MPSTMAPLARKTAERIHGLTMVLAEGCAGIGCAIGLEPVFDTFGFRCRPGQSRTRFWSRARQQKSRRYDDHSRESLDGVEQFGWECAGSWRFLSGRTYSRRRASGRRWSLWMFGYPARDWATYRVLTSPNPVFHRYRAEHELPRYTIVARSGIRHAGAFPLIRLWGPAAMMKPERDGGNDPGHLAGVSGRLHPCPRRSDSGLASAVVSDEHEGPGWPTATGFAGISDCNRDAGSQGRHAGLHGDSRPSPRHPRRGRNAMSADSVSARQQAVQRRCAA